MLLTEAEWMERMRVEYASVDKGYRQYELGQDVGRYLRAKRVEEAAASTLESYEFTLRLLVLDHRDMTLPDFDGGAKIDLLYDFLDKWWSDAAPSTRHVRAAAIRGFFQWAEDTERIVRSPARRLKIRKRSKRAVRRAHDLELIQRIALAQESISHQAFILVMGRLGLRKMEAASLRIRDVDLRRDVIYLEDSKSGEPAEVAIDYHDVRAALDLWLREGHHRDTRLIAPRSHPTRKANQATVHRRFKQCLEAAGVEDFPMHELRHSAGDFIYHHTGDTRAAKDALRHSSMAVTEGYLHPTQEDLRRRKREAEQAWRQR